MKRSSLVALGCLCMLAPSPVTAQAQPPVAEPAQATTATDAEMPSFASLFRDLPSDFLHLVSPDAGIVLGAGGALSLAVHPADHTLTDRASSATTLEQILDPGQVIGGGYAQAGFAVGTYFVGRIGHNARLATVGAALVRAQIVTATLTEGIKVSVRRRRPNGGNLSFPSGHTSATTATASVLQREFGWKIGVPAYSLAAYVAISRLSERAHYASDLAFGAAIGVVAGRSVTLRRGKHEITFAPLGSPGGAGGAVTWTAAP
jgi:membrane-associated phospholipid phosphatase